jgi:mannose-1-phosphate guanylyltransferase
MVEEGVLYGLASSTYWTDTGTPPLFLEASLDFVRGLRGEVPAPGAKERQPGVWTLGGSVIDGEIVAPCLVGDAAYIASGATVEESVIGGGCRVEAGAKVTRSVLLPGSVVHAGAVVDRSIIGEGAVIGADAEVTELTVVQGRASVAPGASVAAGRIAVEA